MVAVDVPKLMMDRKASEWAESLAQNPQVGEGQGRPWISDRPRARPGGQIWRSWQRGMSPVMRDCTGQCQKRRLGREAEAGLASVGERCQGEEDDSQQQLKEEFSGPPTLAVMTLNRALRQSNFFPPAETAPHTCALSLATWYYSTTNTETPLLRI